MTIPRSCRLLRVLVVLALCFPVSDWSVAAQNKPRSGAVIAGHVVFADTDKPARFATVYLKAMAPADAADDFFTVLMDSAIGNMQSKQAGGVASSDDLGELRSARAAANGLLTQVTDAMLSATVSAEGEYVFTDVPPGSYYIHVKAPGYVDTLSAFSADELSSREPEVRKKILAAVETVAVMGTESVREDFRLQRGAVLTGRVSYDDGSPAPGWTVRAIPQRLAGNDPPTSVLGIDLGQLPSGPRTDRTLTDDTGHFRIAGLPAATYIVEATLNTAALDRQAFSPVSSTSGSFLSMLGGLSGLSSLHVKVYSGNATLLHDAEAVKLKAGEETDGYELVVPLSSSHSVTGFVLARRDGHLINDGTVELVAHDKQGGEDSSLRLTAALHADGTFRFDYVPAPGTYTVRCLHPSDATSVKSSMKLLGSVIAEHTISRVYARASTTVELRDADVSGVKLTVEDPPAQTSRNDPGPTSLQP